MKLPEYQLISILRSEEKMEAYLRQNEKNPSKIDPAIWQIHLSIPEKKRMNAMNKFFRNLLIKEKILNSFLTENMIIAKVYKILNIPYTVSPNIKSPFKDYLKVKTIPKKCSQLNKYKKYYNTELKILKQTSLGIYDFDDESPNIIPFAEFRRRQQINKSKTKTKCLFDELLENDNGNPDIITRNNTHEVTNRFQKNKTEKTTTFDKPMPYSLTFKKNKSKSLLNPKAKFNSHMRAVEKYKESKTKNIVNVLLIKNVINHEKKVENSNSLNSFGRNEKIVQMDTTTAVEVEVLNEENINGSKTIPDGNKLTDNLRSVNSTFNHDHISAFIEESSIIEKRDTFLSSKWVQEQNCESEIRSVEKTKKYENKSIEDTIGLGSVKSPIRVENHTNEISASPPELTISDPSNTSIIKKLRKNSNIKSKMKYICRNPENTVQMSFDQNETCNATAILDEEDSENKNNNPIISDKQIVPIYKNAVGEIDSICSNLNDELNFQGGEDKNVEEPILSLHSGPISQSSSSDTYVELIPVSQLNVNNYSRMNKVSKIMFPNEKNRSPIIGNNTNKNIRNLRISVEKNNREILKPSSMSASDSEIEAREMDLKSQISSYNLNDSNVNEIYIAKKLSNKNDEKSSQAISLITSEQDYSNTKTLSHIKSTCKMPRQSAFKRFLDTDSDLDKVIGSKKSKSPVKKISKSCLSLENTTIVKNTMKDTSTYRKNPMTDISDLEVCLEEDSGKKIVSASKNLVEISHNNSSASVISSETGDNNEYMNVPITKEPFRNTLQNLGNKKFQSHIRLIVDTESDNELIVPRHKSINEKSSKDRTNQTQLVNIEKSTPAYLRNKSQKFVDSSHDLEEKGLFTSQKLFSDSSERNSENYDCKSNRNNRTPMRQVIDESVTKRKRKLCSTKMEKMETQFTKKINTILNYKVVKSPSRLNKINESKKMIHKNHEIPLKLKNEGNVLFDNHRSFKKLYSDNSNETRTNLRKYPRKFQYNSLSQTKLKRMDSNDEKTSFSNNNSDSSSSIVATGLKKLSLETNCSAILFSSSEISTNSVKDVKSVAVNNSLNVELQGTNEAVDEIVSFDRVNEMIKGMPKTIQDLNDLSTEEASSDFCYSTQNVLTNTSKESDVSSSITTKRTKIVRKRKERNILRKHYQISDSSDEDNVFRNTSHSSKQRGMYSAPVESVSLVEPMQSQQILGVSSREKENVNSDSFQNEEDTEKDIRYEGYNAYPSEAVMTSNHKNTNNDQINVLSSPHNEEITHTTQTESLHFIENTQEKQDTNISMLKYDFLSEDDYGSEEITSDLNKNLLQLNYYKNNADSDVLENHDNNESVGTFDYDEDIHRLQAVMSEVAVLNKEQNITGTGGHSTETEPVIQETLSKIGNREENGFSSTNCSNQDSQSMNMSTFHEMLWNSYPDSLETALTTPDQKLEEVRENLLKRLKEENRMNLLNTSLMHGESSKESDSDGINFFNSD